MNKIKRRIIQEKSKQVTLNLSDGVAPTGVNLSTAVILSEAKDLSLGPVQILRFAQGDRLNIKS